MSQLEGAARSDARAGGGEILLMVAAILPLAATPVAITMQPGMVQGMVDFFGFTQPEAGFVVSAEVFGIMAGAIGFAIVGGRVSWRWALFAGLILTIAANLVCIVRNDYASMLALRAVAGLGGGLAAAIGWNVLAQGRDPSRGFGWGTAAIILFAAGGFALLSTLFALGGYSAFLLAFSIAVAACLPLALVVRRRAPAEEASAEAPARGGGWSAPGALSLLSILVFSAAFTMAWTYMSLVGHDAGLEGPAIAKVFSLTQFFGVAGALSMAAVGAAFGFSRPAVVVLGAGAVAIAALTVLSSLAAFFAANAVFQFTWNAGIPIVLGVIAVRSLGGALFRLAVPLQFVGMAAGPSLAALLLDGEDYSLVVWTSAGLLIVSLLALVPLILVRPPSAEPASGP
jgi:predicted MFS family arabinose efflux permease